MADRKIGMWMYSNGGGDVIEKKLQINLKIEKLMYLQILIFVLQKAPKKELYVTT